MKTRNCLTWLAAAGLTLGLAAGCSGAKTGGSGEEEGKGATEKAPSFDPSRTWTEAMKSREQFMAFSEQVSGERFVKLLVDLRSDETYYFDVGVFPLHSDFIFKELQGVEPTPELLARFQQNYDEDKPEYLLPYIVYHLDQDLWTFSFYEGDRGTKDAVMLAWDKIQATFFAADEIKYRPDSGHQEWVAQSLDIPVITNSEIYSQSTYQCFNEGRALGTLRIVKHVDAKAALSFERDDIVLLAEPLPQLSVVSGIISEEFSTPLSHVALRAKAWGIPHVGVKNAAVRYKPLVGKKVVLRASPEGYELRLATVEEVAQHEARTEKTRTVVVPEADLKQRALKRLQAIKREEVTAYGAKTANLGQIASAGLDGFHVPPGVGIPIAYYHEHLTRHGLDKRVEALLRDPKVKTDSAYRRQQLGELKAAIVAAPIDEALVEGVLSILAKAAKGAEKRVFVRSSTNCEDLAGFNGAGLYDTVPNVQGRDAVGAAIKTVWASVWNPRAFEEREFYGIDHRGVYGAVLVQTGINATAAGVLVTTNLLEPSDRDTYTINAKWGLGIRVVEGKKVPEQLLFNVKEDRIKVMSRSDEETMLVFKEGGGVKEVAARGRVVLTDERARSLARASRAITELFPKDDPLDIEWLFEGEELHIVQARPYVTGAEANQGK